MEWNLKNSIKIQNWLKKSYLAAKNKVYLIQVNIKSKKTKMQGSKNGGKSEIQSPKTSAFEQNQRTFQLTFTKEQIDEPPSRMQTFHYGIASQGDAELCGTCGRTREKEELAARPIQKSFSEISSSSKNCSDPQGCVWKKRCMDLLRENEQIKQKFKESLSQMETRYSSLISEKITLASDKQSLEELVKQQQFALKKSYSQFANQLTKLKKYESQLGDHSITGQSPIADGFTPGAFQPIYMHSRQSEMIQAKNRPLHSEIGWPSGRKQDSIPWTASNVPILGNIPMQEAIGQNQMSDETTTIRMPLLSSNLNLEMSSSPGTGKQNTTNGTSAVPIIEEKEQDDSVDKQNDSDLANRASDFSLSNAADVNPKNGEITPLRQEDGNMTADDFVIECGKSSEGVGERNNPFEQHGFTHYVENEETPCQPKKKSFKQIEEETRKSQTFDKLFKDELLKQTPSFVDMDEQRQNAQRNETKSEIERLVARGKTDGKMKSFNACENKAPYSQNRDMQQFLSSSQTSSIPPRVGSMKTISTNAWVQTMGQQAMPAQTNSVRNLFAQSSNTQNMPLTETNKQQRNNPLQQSKASQHTMFLQQSERSLLNQPHDRVDSDEIELKDSEDGFDENSDDCEFNSLEGNARPNESRLPKTQTKFNQTVDQLNQMNRLDVQNKSRILAIVTKQQKAQLHRITEETLTMTTDFASTMNKDTNRIDSECRDNLIRPPQIYTQAFVDFHDKKKADGLSGLREVRSSEVAYSPVINKSSTAIIIDDDEDGDEDLFGREDVSNRDDILFEENSSVARDGPLRMSELDLPQSELSNYGRNNILDHLVKLEPLEAVQDDESQDQEGEFLDPSNKSESVVQFHARFSTLMSERESTIHMGLEKRAFFLPKSFSQAVPTQNQNIYPNHISEHLELVQLSEYSPSTNLVRNQLFNQKPQALSNQLPLESGFELNLGKATQEGQDRYLEWASSIEENVDGEESKESVVSNQRLHGASLVKRGNRDTTLLQNSENDTTSQVETHLVAFNSRQRMQDLPIGGAIMIGKHGKQITEESGGKYSSGNEGKDRKAFHSNQKRTQQESFCTPPTQHLEDDFQDDSKQIAQQSKVEKSSSKSKSFLYPPVLVANFEKSSVGVTTVYATADNETASNNNLNVEKIDSSFEKEEEPAFFGKLQAEALRSSRRDFSNQGQLSQNENSPREDSQHAQQHELQQQLLAQSMLNKSISANKLQNSMMFENRRGSDAILMQPRNSFINNLGFRKSKQSTAMHATIVKQSFNQQPHQKNLIFNQIVDNPHQYSRRMSYRSRDGTIKLKSTVVNTVVRNHSIAGKSLMSSLPMYSNDEDGEDELPPEYELPEQSEEKMQRMQQMTKNYKQNQNRREMVGQANPIRDYDNKSNHAKTADSGQLKILADEFAGKQSTFKKQLDKIKLPQSEIFFAKIPAEPRASFVSIGDASPIAEEESRVTWESEKKTLQQSPSIQKHKRKLMGYFDGDNQQKQALSAAASRVSQQLFPMSSSIGIHKKKESMGKMVMDTMIGVGQKLMNLGKNHLRIVEQQEDLMWFQQLISLKTIQSDFFFEKYMVCSVSDETLGESQLKHKSRKTFLQKPSILFREPSITRTTSNFNQTKYLLDDATVDIIADFCFPNGVPVVKMCDLAPGVPLEQQSQKTQENINEICFLQKNLREDMFFFQLDASDSVELQDGEQIYGDCHLVALVHTFFDFKELNGQLYLVKMALCVVTTTQANFGLLQELLEKNIRMIREARLEMQMNPMLDLSVYPVEIKSCLQIRYENPPDQVRVLLERVRTYKISNSNEALYDQDSPEMFANVILDDGETLNYEFPRSVHQALAEMRIQKPITMNDLQYDLIEHHWHLPTFFSLFGPSTFYKLLTAVLLERSIVFVHNNLSVISSVILSLKTLLRPFMWCHSLIPVLPRALLDHILQPLPVLVGITIDDYQKVLMMTTEHERRYKTWIFLDWTLEAVFQNEPYYLPFDKAESDLDEISGIRIVWGTMDNDFSQDYRCERLLGWLDDFKVKAKPLFADFKAAATSIELGAESLYPLNPGSIDMQYMQQSKEERATEAASQLVGDQDHNRQYFETLEDTRQSLNEKLTTQRKMQKSQELSSVQRSGSLKKSEPFQGITGLILQTQGTEEETVLQGRDSQASVPDQLLGQTRFTGHLAQNEAITEENEFQCPYIPIVLVANQKICKILDQLCLQLACTYKHKIIDLVPELCRRCGITEADQIFDSMQIADNIGSLSQDPAQKDAQFLEQFAYTQMFSFLLENYMGALNQKKQQQQESLEGKGWPLSRQSNVLNLFNYPVSEELRSRAMSSQQSRISFEFERNDNREQIKGRGGVNDDRLGFQTVQPQTLHQILQGSKSNSRAASNTSRK